MPIWTSFATIAVGKGSHRRPRKKQLITQEPTITTRMKQEVDSIPEPDEEDIDLPNDDGLD